MVDEDLKRMADEAEKAIKDRDAAIQRVVSKVGNVVLNVCSSGVKWSYRKDDYGGRVGVATGVRARFRFGSGQRLVVEVSPQANGNFYPHEMSVSELIDAVGGGDAFNQMLVAGIKTAVEDAKKTVDALKEQEVDVGSAAPATSREWGKPRSLGDGALKFLKKT